jgi:hypothetical protein
MFVRVGDTFHPNSALPRVSNSISLSASQHLLIDLDTRLKTSLHQCVMAVPMGADFCISRNYHLGGTSSIPKKSGDGDQLAPVFS